MTLQKALIRDTDGRLKQLPSGDSLPISDIENLTKGGAGDAFLANDGTYKSANYAVVETSTDVDPAAKNTIYLVTTDASEVTITLPDATGAEYNVRVYKASALTTPPVRITTAGGSQLIDGQTIQSIYGPGEGISLMAQDSSYSSIQDSRGRVQSRLSRSTGVLSGMTITQSGTNTIDIAPGLYVIEDPDSLSAPTSTMRWYPGASNVVITGVATQGYTTILINSAMEIVQVLNAIESSEQIRTHAKLGSVTHACTGQIEGASSLQTVSQNPNARLTDFMYHLGAYKKGFPISGPGNGTLQISCGAGEFTYPGLNYTNVYDPDTASHNAQTPVTTILYCTRDTFIGYTTGSNALIDVSHYDLDGVVTAIGGNNDDCAITRVFRSNELIIVQYGQNTYTSPVFAREALFQGQDSFITNPKLAGIAVLLGTIIAEKTVTSLDDTDHAFFYTTDSYGNFSTSGGGSGSARITRSVNVVLDGEGMVLQTGIRGDYQAKTAGVIQSVTLLADQTGSVQVDIWKDTYTNYPPTDDDSITSATPPAIVSGIKSEDATLTGWTTTINIGDILRFNVDSVADITRLTIILEIEDV